MICALDEKFPEIREEIQQLADNIGADYDTARIIYETNNGHGLDKAPNGAQSKLYNDLLSHYNDNVRQAQIAKAKLYLTPFREWFGDWTDVEATDVSKVVDENGEPLLTYRGVNDNNFNSRYIYFTDSVAQALTHAKGLFTKGGSFYSNRKEISFALSSYLTSKYNLISTDLDYLSSFIEPIDERDVFDEIIEIDDDGHVMQKLQYAGTEEVFDESNLAKLATRSYKILTSNQEAKEIIDILHLIDRTTLKNENDLFRQYDDPYYSQDLKELNSLLKKYDTVIQQFKSEYKPDIVAAFLAIKNPYTEEINSEDLLHNYLAYAHGHDGAFLMDGENFLIMDNTGQIFAIGDVDLHNITDYGTKHSLRLRSFPQKLRDQGLIHKRNGSWYITKERYNSPQEYESLVQYIDKEAAISGNLVKFVPTRSATKVVFMEKAILHDKLPQDNRGNYKSVERLLYFLHDRFPNLEFEVVPQSQAKYKNQNAWIEGNRIYLVEGKFTDEIAIHEALHPFVSALHMDNKALFEHLFEEAKLSYPKLWDQIQSTYTEKGMSDATRAQELVAQALAREFNVDHSKAPKGRSFWECAKMFIDWIKAFFSDFATVRNGIIYINHNNLPKMTLSQLAKMLNTNDTVFDINVDANQIFNSLSSHDAQLAKLDKQFEVVKVSLQQRLKSLQNYKKKNLNVIRQTANLVKQLHELDSKQGMIAFVQDAMLKIQEAYNYITDESNKISYHQLVQLQRDLLGFYLPSINNLVGVLDIFEDVKGFEDDFYNLKRLADNTERAFDRTIREYALKLVTDYQHKIGVPDEEIQKTIEYINNPFNDVSFIAAHTGSNQMSSNVYVRIARRMLGDAENETARNTFKMGRHLVGLLAKARNAIRFKTTKSVESLFQEVDKDGKKTGNFVRDLNYGQYWQDYDKFLQQLYKDLNIKLDEDNRPVFESDEQERQFRDATDTWKCKHGERPYRLEYYLAKNKHLSRLTRETLDEVDSEIRDLLKSVTPPGGTPQLHKMSDAEFARYTKLLKDKQQLYSPYNLDGTAKNGEELQIANELIAFRAELSSKVGHKVNYEAFEDARWKIISEYGEDSAEYERWKYINTEVGFSEEYLDIRRRLGEVSRLSKINTEAAKTYRELLQIRANILKYYRKYHDTVADVESMPNNVVELVKQLDRDIADLKQQLMEYAKVYGIKSGATVEMMTILEQHPSITKKTDYYNQLKSIAQQELSIDPDAVSKFHENTSFEDSYGNRVIYSLYEYSYPMFDSDVIHEKPNGMWSMLDEESEWVNPNFDRSAGTYVQPKRSMYDNSKAYAFIQSIPELKELYDELLNAMHESNDKINFVEQADDYKLPQMSARLMTVLRREGNVFKNIGHYVSDEMGVRGDDVDYVEKATIRPDGTPLYHVPTKFMQRLKDPNMITSDVIGSVIAYYQMAENFKNKSAIEDELELHRYFLRKAIPENANLVQRGLGYLSKKGIDVNPPSWLSYALNGLSKYSHAVDKYEKELEMDLYGRKKKQITFGKVNVTKYVQLFQKWTSIRNLGLNIHPAVGGAIAASTLNAVEAAAKKYFTHRDLAFAETTFDLNLPELILSIGDPDTKNKFVQLMQMNQICKSVADSFSDLDMSQITRAVYQNAVMGHFTASDFAVKGKILLSVYNNYRLVNTPTGPKFMSMQQYISQFYPTNKKKGELEFYKTEVNLYDVFVKNSKTGIIEIDPKYKDYVTDSLLNEVTNKVLSISQRADGTLSDLDKAHIHQDAYLSFTTIHRNWIITGYEMMFMSEKFNYETMEYERGRLSAASKRAWTFVRNFRNMNVKEWWNQSSDTEKYAMKYMCMLAMTYLGLRLFTMLMKDLADDDDDSLILQMLAYDLTRGLLEISSIYNPAETNNTLKTISPAADLMESIFNFLLKWEDADEEVTRGAYEDWNRKLVHFIKLTPFKNLVEGYNAEGIKDKREYLEVQIQF